MAPCRRSNQNAQQPCDEYRRSEQANRPPDAISDHLVHGHRERTERWPHVADPIRMPSSHAMSTDVPSKPTVHQMLFLIISFTVIGNVLKDGPMSPIQSECPAAMR